MSKYTLIVPIAADTDKMGTEMPYLFGLDSNGLMYCVKSIMGLPLEAFSDIYFTILHKHNLRYKLLEKDAARLRSVPFDDAIKKALYFLPIHVRFMQHTGTSFDEKISDIIYKNRRSKQVKK